VSLGVPIVLILGLVVLSVVSRTPRRLPRVLERLDIDGDWVRVVALVEEPVPIAEIRAVRFDDELLELTLARGTRAYRVPVDRIEHVHRCVERLSAIIGRPALPIVATTHDGVRLNLDPVFTPIGPFLAPVAAAGSALCIVATYVLANSPPPESELSVVGLGLGVLALALGAAQDRRVELAVEGRRLVLRRANRWWRSTRSLPLAEVRRVEVSRDRLLVVGATTRLRVPLGQRTAATAAVVRRFVLEQVEQARVLHGEVPADLARLRGARER
jgi:hypothetical protein